MSKATIRDARNRVEKFEIRSQLLRLLKSFIRFCRLSATFEMWQIGTLFSHSATLTDIIQSRATTIISAPSQNTGLLSDLRLVDAGGALTISFDHHTSQSPKRTSVKQQAHIGWLCEECHWVGDRRHGRNVSAEKHCLNCGHEKCDNFFSACYEWDEIAFDRSKGC